MKNWKANSLRTEDTCMVIYMPHQYGAITLFFLVLVEAIARNERASRQYTSRQMLETGSLGFRDA